MNLVWYLVVFLLLAILLALFPVAKPVIVKVPEGALYRVEALDDAIVRVWIKAKGQTFSRELSLATKEAPKNRVRLKVNRKGEITTVSTAALSVRFDKSQLGFEVIDLSSGKVIISQAALTWRPQGTKDKDSAWTLTTLMKPEEQILGLGQDNRNNGHLNRRGVVREIWAGQQISSGNVTAEYPIPVMYSLGADGQAHGVFFDNAHRLKFDIGKSKSDILKLDADGGEIDLYILAGPNLSDIVERYTRLTGRPALPPLWALGYWQSKCTYYNWEALDTAYNELTNRGFPVDIMVIDYDWPVIANNFEWAKRWFVDGKTPAERIRAYLEKGVRIVMSQSGPMIRKESSTFATGWKMGVFATDGQDNPVECGHYGGKLIDFTHPCVNRWLWPQVAARIQDGVAGWWLDLTEPEGEPPQTHYYGGRPANVHNIYSLLNTQSFEGVQLQEYPNRRPFVLTRAGSAGLQRYHVAVWTGDVYSDYATLRAHTPEMINSALSGFNWWTSDSGGFMNGYYKNDMLGAHARLYERWMQFSVFSPITRAHKAGGLPEPYQFGPGVEQTCRHYLELRYRLLPYIYSYAWEATRTGVPLVRAMALEYQYDPKAVAAPGDQYLFGSELLVAPAHFEGQVNRNVYIPEGRWFDWDYGYVYEGGRDWVVAAPQNRIPVLIKAGAIIPMAPFMRSTGEKPWDPISIKVFPSGESSFTLYQDDGKSFAYRKGDFTLTQLKSKLNKDKLEFTIEASNTLYVPQKYQMEFYLESVPESVILDGGSMPAGDGDKGWNWDAQKRLLTIPLSVIDTPKHRIEVQLGAGLDVLVSPELELDVINASGECAGAVGPVPHFCPSPALPGRIRGSNYDKGGEGVAYNLSRELPSVKAYRDDDIGCAESTDVGGGFVLGGLRKDEWVSYTVDARNGGFFDVVVRLARVGSALARFKILEQAQPIVSFEVPADAGEGQWVDIMVPNVYLNPGETPLMLFVEEGGFLLGHIEFRAAQSPPSEYDAALAKRMGNAERMAPGEGTTGVGYIKNLGRMGSGLTFGVLSPRAEAGAVVLSFRYNSYLDHALPFTLQINDQKPMSLEIEGTNSQWVNLDIPVMFEPGVNRVILVGQLDGWDNLSIDKLIVKLD